MKSLFKRFKFTIALVTLCGLFAASLFTPSPVRGQDTVSYSYSTQDVGYSVTTSFVKDSTKATVTGWFDLTSFYGKNLVLSHTFTDSDYGRTAGNDTLRCILQVKDNLGNIFNSDTIGTGSEGAEKIYSLGTPAQYTITAKKYAPLGRLYFEAVNTGTFKNGRGRYSGSLFAYPK